MKSLSSEQFAQWMRQRGYVLHRHGYVQIEHDVPPETRFWEVPEEAYRFPYFVRSVLETVDPWGECVLHSREWLNVLPFDAGRVRDRMLLDAGVPEGHRGAIAFERGEWERVHQILSIEALFGGHYNIQVLFDHGRQLIRTDHHEVIHVECHDARRMREVIQTMIAAGFDLPGYPPDWTFAWPDWMGPTPDDWCTGKGPAKR
jgi:hypothetical protein